FALIDSSPCVCIFDFRFPAAESISPHSFLAIFWTVPDRVVTSLSWVEERRQKERREIRNPASNETGAQLAAAGSEYYRHCAVPSIARLSRPFRRRSVVLE